MIFITIVFALIFILYNWLMYSAYGKLWSVSAGYYKLKSSKGGAEWIFTMFLFIIAAYMFAVIVKTNHPIFAIPTLGAILVGVATEYKKRVTTLIHYVGSALIMGGGAFGCGIALGNWWAVAIIASAGLITWGLWKTIASPLYWFEMISFITIILCLTF